MRYVHCLLLGFLSNILFAQNNLYVAEFMEGVSLLKADSSGYYFQGNSKIFKTDLNTYPIWSKSMSGNFKVIKLLKNGDFLWYRDLAGPNFELVRTSDQCTVIWSKSYQSGSGSDLLGISSIVEDSHYNCFILNHNTSDDSELLMIDSLGNIVKAKNIYLGQGYHLNNGFLNILNNDQLIMHGPFSHLGGSGNILFLLDDNLESASGYMHLFFDYIGVMVRENGMIIRADATQQTVTPLGQYILSFDSTFNCYNQTRINHWGFGGGLQSTSDNGFLMAYDSKLIRFDSLFNILWIKPIISANSTSFVNDKSILESFDKNILVSYNFNVSNTPHTIFIKADSLGNSVCGTADSIFNISSVNVSGSFLNTTDTDSLFFFDSISYTSQSTSVSVSNVSHLNGYYICSTSIEDGPLSGNEIGLYPNPFTRAIDLSIDEALLNNSEKKQLFVYNAIGELVLSEDNLISKMRIELNESTSGIYFVRLIIGDKQFVQKIIKE